MKRNTTFPHWLLHHCSAVRSSTSTSGNNTKNNCTAYFTLINSDITQCDSQPPEERSAVFHLMNLLKLTASLATTPPPTPSRESGIIRDMNRSAFFCLRQRKGGENTFRPRWRTGECARVFNINSLSSRTQLGHLYLTHPIGSK